MSLEKLSEKEKMDIGNRIKKASKLIGDLPVIFNLIDNSDKDSLIPINKKYGNEYIVINNILPEQFKNTPIIGMSVQ